VRRARVLAPIGSRRHRHHNSGPSASSRSEVLAAPAGEWDTVTKFFRTSRAGAEGGAFFPAADDQPEKNWNFTSGTEGAGAL